MKIARMPDGGAEIFYTLQGEGRNVGQPSVFIRSSLCNLHCRWCDTDYTWNWEDTDYVHDSGQKYKREEQILNLDEHEIAELATQYGCANFVFTGGEPLIQEKAWLKLMARLKTETAHFEIETNGTLMPSPDFIKAIHQINISPKLANSGVPKDQRYQPSVLKQLAQLEKTDFKFVVGNQSDLDEIQQIVKQAAINPNRTFIMAQARDLSELETNQGWVAEQAQKAGFRYSDRLHLRLYGAKRGV